MRSPYHVNFLIQTSQPTYHLVTALRFWNVNQWTRISLPARIWYHNQPIIIVSWHNLVLSLFLLVNLTRSSFTFIGQLFLEKYIYVWCTLFNCQRVASLCIFRHRERIWEATIFPLCKQFHGVVVWQSFNIQYKTNTFETVCENDWNFVWIFWHTLFLLTILLKQTLIFWSCSEFHTLAFLTNTPPSPVAR